MPSRRTRSRTTTRAHSRQASECRAAECAGLDELFRGRIEARRLFDGVAAAIAGAGPSTMRVTTSQVAFARRRQFAWVWTPDRWLRGKTAPVVLSLGLSRRLPSRRWKEVVEPRPGRWMHHLEVSDVRQLDAEVRSWIAAAWEDAR